MQRASSHVDENRTALHLKWLASGESHCLWLDSDIGFDGEQLAKAGRACELAAGIYKRKDDSGIDAAERRPDGQLKW